MSEPIHPQSASPTVQCECGLPVPHRPHELGWPVQTGSAAFPATLDANTESFFCNFVEPQCGHSVPCQSVVRTRISLSRSHLSQ